MTRRLCLVTGASAGIGQAFARIFASHGYDVALTARRAERLEHLAEEIRLRYEVREHWPCRPTSPTLPPSTICWQTLTANGREVDALVNNAGYGVNGAYAATSWDDERAFLQVLLRRGLRADPQGAARDGGAAVRADRERGVAGRPRPRRCPAPRSTARPSRFLVRFSESLHLETREQGVHVSALCPGYTYTEFHDANRTREQVSRRTPEWLWLDADEVAAAGYEAVEANRVVCVPGAPNKALAALTRIVPEDWALALIAREQRRTGRF